MRLYRLCEHEGRIDVSTYIAFRDHVTIGEALEMEAAVCAIGDFRAEFSDFMRDYKPSMSAGLAPTSDQQATPEDLRAEITHRESLLERARAARLRHRAAVAYAASGQQEPPGRLTRAAIDAVDQSIAAQESAIAYLRAKLEATHGD